MKNIAIICEYNPMHNGHIHQISQIKKRFPDSRIIALMSGSFVQRGEASILNKFDKAEIAVLNGVDLVIEIPAIVSLQSADYFAHYCVKILNEMSIVDYISFGIEDELDNFNSNVEKIINDKDKIDKLQKELIKSGNSYKKAFLLSLDKLNIDSSILKKPNNTLAFLYVIALKKINSTIIPFPIRRLDGGYDSSNLDEFKFQSASTIRSEFKNNKDISKYTPKETVLKLEVSNIVSIDDYSDIFYYKASIQKFSPDHIAGYENGMLNLLLNNFTGSLSEAIKKSHNKRYSLSRLNRFVFNYLLEIKTKDVLELNNLKYISPLKFNNRGADMIKQIKKISDIEIINNIVRFTENLNNQRYLNIDIKAYKLQNIFKIKDIDRIYKEIPYLNVD